MDLPKGYFLYTDDIYELLKKEPIKTKLFVSHSMEWNT